MGIDYLLDLMNKALSNSGSRDRESLQCESGTLFRVSVIPFLNQRLQLWFAPSGPSITSNLSTGTTYERILITWITAKYRALCPASEKSTTVPSNSVSSVMLAASPGLGRKTSDAWNRT
jgi:hypothetical protein